MTHFSLALSLCCDIGADLTASSAYRCSDRDFWFLVDNPTKETERRRGFCFGVSLPLESDIPGGPLVI
jgi:hypothetical protein